MTQSTKSLNHQHTKTLAFTLVELVIVIFIMGILSVLLFRTLGEMTRMSSRMTYEKVLSQEVHRIHTTLTYMTNIYPYIDFTAYTDYNHGVVDTLRLIDKEWKQASLGFTGDCALSWCRLYLSEHNNTITLSDPQKSILTGIAFKLLPSQPYSTGIFDLDYDTISQPWVWMFGEIAARSDVGIIKNITLPLQYFINLPLSHGL